MKENWLGIYSQFDQSLIISAHTFYPSHSAGLFFKNFIILLYMHVYFHLYSYLLLRLVQLQNVCYTRNRCVIYAIKNLQNIQQNRHFVQFRIISIYFHYILLYTMLYILCMFSFIFSQYFVFLLGTLQNLSVLCVGLSPRLPQYIPGPTDWLSVSIYYSGRSPSFRVVSLSCWFQI